MFFVFLLTIFASAKAKDFVSYCSNNDNRISLGSNPSGILASHFEEQLQYEDDLDIACTWQLEPPNGETAVLLSIEDFQLQGDCKKNFVKLTSGDVSKTFCDDSSTNLPEIPCGSPVQIDAKLTVNLAVKGFKIRFQAEKASQKCLGDRSNQEEAATIIQVPGPDSGCGSLRDMTGKRGLIRSHLNFGENNYANNLKCEWRIASPFETDVIALKFYDNFGIRPSGGLSISYEDQATGKQELLRYSGNNAPKRLVLPSNSAKVVFKSGISQTGAGFKVVWAVIDRDLLTTTTTTPSTTTTKKILDPACLEGGKKLTSPSGTIMAPGSDDYSECSWTIEPKSPGNDRILTKITLKLRELSFDREQLYLPPLEIVYFDSEKANQEMRRSYPAHEDTDETIVIETRKPVRVILQSDSQPNRRHRFALDYEAIFRQPSTTLAPQTACGQLQSGSASPWIVGLTYKRGEYQCTATIIKEKWLVTAASCFGRDRTNKVHWSVKSANGRQSLAIARIFAHTSYQTYTMASDNDIALVSLKSPIVFGTSVSPICTSAMSPPLSANRQCYAVSSNTIQVKIVDISECESDPYLSNFYYDSLTENVLCASLTSTSFWGNQCQGYPGASLICLVSGRWHLYGVLSVPNGCMNENLARNKMAIFTKIANYYTNNWITGVIEKYP